MAVLVLHLVIDFYLILSRGNLKKDDEFKIQVPDKITEKNEISHDNANKPRTFIVKIKSMLFSRKAALAALFVVMFLAVFATMRDSVIGRIEEFILTRIKAPFFSVEAGHHYINYPPYFIINLSIIFICIFLILLIYTKRAGGPVWKYKIDIATWLVFVIAAVLYGFQVGLFLVNRSYIMQGFLYLCLTGILGAYYYRWDNKNGVKIYEGRLFAPKEQRNLFIFTAAVFLLYVWDYASWKYCFIGDEYAFYDYAVKIARGILPLRFFYETGVYGDHPVLASIFSGGLMKIFGTNLFGWKLSAVIVPVITVIPLYMWVKLIFKKRVAVITVIAFVFSAAMLAFSHIPYDVIQAVFPFVLSLLLLELAIRKNSKFWSFLAGVVMALGCYTYYTSRLTVLAAGLYWFFHPLRRKYAVSNLAAGLAIYAATILFIFLNPDFADHMLVHSVFKGSEIADVSKRPFYMMMNYMITFFAFLYKPNMSHFIAGSTAEWLSAAGALAGLVWCFMAFKKDWRAKWLISSYAVLVFFTGAIVQYSYSPNTRVSFLAPIVCILAGVGLSRLIAVFASLFKIKPYSRYIASVFVVVTLIAVNGIWYFYFYMPKVFLFTPESLVVKYMQEKADLRKIYVMVTGEFIRDTHLPQLYKFPKGFMCIGLPEFENMLANKSAKGKVFIFQPEILKVKPEMNGIVRKGCSIYGFEGAPAAFMFDLTDDKYFEGFKQLWDTGKTFLPIDGPEMPPVMAGGIEVKKSITIDVKESERLKKNIRNKFIAGVLHRDMKVSLIDKYTANKLKLNAGPGIFCDIACSADGGIIYITDGSGKKINIFKRKSWYDYNLEKTVRFYPGQNACFEAFNRLFKSGENSLYICFNPQTGGFFALDPGEGMVKEFDAYGALKRQVLSSGYLLGAGSLRRSATDGILIAAVPSQNMITVFDTNGRIINNLTANLGSALGQFSRPSYAAFGKNRDIFVVDANNGRVQRFDADFNYLQFYRLGTLTKNSCPQLVICDNEKEPYFMALQPLYKRLLLYSLNENRIRILELKDIKGSDLYEPCAITVDASGAVYILDTKTKTVIKIGLPKDVLSESHGAGK